MTNPRVQLNIVLTADQAKVIDKLRKRLPDMPTRQKFARDMLISMLLKESSNATR